MLFAMTSLWPSLVQICPASYGRTITHSALVLRSQGFYPEMLPPWIRRQLFDGIKPSSRSTGKTRRRKAVIRASDDISPSPDTSKFESNAMLSLSSQSFDLPGLTTGHVSSYFTETAIKQVDEYLSSLQGLIAELPPVPQTWLLTPGWVCYREGSSQPVEGPDSNALVLDVEVCVKESFAPVLATAVTPQSWYCWVSPSLIQDKTPKCSSVFLDNLIPLGMKGVQKRVIVGHYVMYDAARLKESYDINNSNLRFFDTMAAHISISGVTNLQKLWAMKTSAKLPWVKLASGNSLGQLYHLYCGRYLDKSKRNVFVEGSLEDIRTHFQELTSYCAQDVVATHALFCKLFPLLRERFPHPITMAAMLEMSCLHMPISGEWERFLHETKHNNLEMEKEISFLLQQVAQETCELMHGNKYSRDPWMWDQNWSIKEKVTCRAKKSEKSQTSLVDSPSLTNSCEGTIFHHVSMSKYPEWYRKISSPEDVSSPLNQELSLTLRQNITPKLLRLCWGPYPLHFIRSQGWGMLVPSCEESIDTISMFQDSLPAESIYEMCTTGLTHQSKSLYQEWQKHDGDSPYYQDIASLRDSIENANSNVGEKSSDKNDFPDSTTEVKLQHGILFRKLPHCQGIGKNVGSPLSKDLINNFALCSRDARGQRILTLLRQKQIQSKFIDRFESLPVVWLDGKSKSGAVIPEMVVTGDFIRHPTEELLSVLSSNKQDLILCRAVEAPPGWWFLSADMLDVDLWMASLLSDSIVGRYGGTPLGDLVLNNSYYSCISTVMEVSEDEAKWLAHAVLFGASKGFLAKMLRQIDPSLSKMKALGRTERLLEHLLGTHTSVDSESISLWQGGVQSELWSKLSVAASKLEVQTPILSSRLSRVLESDTKKFFPLAMSWIIQSSSVDFLHLLAVSFRDLAPYARLSLISSSGQSVHYLVPNCEKYHAAKALHLAHLYARAFCASQVGMSDLPIASAFLPYVQLSRFLKSTKQEVIKLNFFEATKQSEINDHAGRN